MRKKFFVSALWLFVFLEVLGAVQLTPYRTEGNCGKIDSSNPVYIMGEPCNNGFKAGTGWEGNSFTQLYNLKNNYRVLSCTIAPSDDVGIGQKLTFEFYVDNEKIASYSIAGGGFPEEIEIPLNYGRQLKLYVGGDHAVISDMDFK